jgi:peptidoglycan lytic transglycosylase G
LSEQLSDLGLELGHEKKHRPRRSLGCLAVLLALVVLLGAGYVAYSYGITAIKDKLAGPEDYSGNGTGRVLVEVQDGDAASDIAATLKDKDVVKSVQAFTDAARQDSRSVGIQVGFYELRKQMSATAALKVLVDPANRMRSVVTIPEGFTVDQIVATLVKKTDFSRKQYDKVLAHPDSIGLPSYAGGNAEGYLFPATYELPPNATPRSILTTMVDRWSQAAKDADLTGAAKRLGYTPAQLMTVASLVEAESNRDADRGKVARVIYNRLEGNATDKLLQIDAAVNYAIDRDLGVALTTEDLQVDSPYNTYKHPGLPPTPIEAPGDAAIAAAANPTPGPWIYYVTVNLRTSETKFTASYDTFLKYKAEFKEYCRTQSDAC